jgi:uncharacterized damage-inducible protein DinB
MDVDTVRLLAVYNEHVNGKMNELISRIDETQWGHRFNAFFASIHATCNHIYIADFNWLKRFGKLRDFAYIKDELFLNELDFSTDAFGAQKEYLSKREYLDKSIRAFVNEVTPADLASALTYTDSRGTENSRNFGGLVLHMFNHQTHHRGMISVYLEMLGVENDYSNLVRLV